MGDLKSITEEIYCNSLGQTFDCPIFIIYIIWWWLWDLHCNKRVTHKCDAIKIICFKNSALYTPPILLLDESHHPATFLINNWGWQYTLHKVDFPSVIWATFTPKWSAADAAALINAQLKRNVTHSHAETQSCFAQRVYLLPPLVRLLLPINTNDSHWSVSTFVYVYVNVSMCLCDQKWLIGYAGLCRSRFGTF